MYFISLPDHTKSDFNEEAHFSKFRKHNIIFNALSTNSHCDYHVGCLSIKTVLSGEEWYGISHRRLAIRPGKFLILNDDQPYSCHIANAGSVRTLSVFFKKEFASSVFQDAVANEETLLDNPFCTGGKTPEFLQTLNDIDPMMHQQLCGLIISLNKWGYDNFRVDEYLVFLLHHLIRVHQSDVKRLGNVKALKPNTRAEIYKRVCVAKDIIHSNYKDKLDLNAVSAAACLSIPQLIRQFKSVFKTTPHQYLCGIRLRHAEELLIRTTKPVSEITWECGFENTSAFCRAFKSAYGARPGSFRLRKTC
jgi:AraC family transcriptional regulator